CAIGRGLGVVTRSARNRHPFIARRLDLVDDETRSVAGDDVDLGALRAHAPVEDHEAFGDQRAHRPLLAELSQLTRVGRKDSREDARKRAQHGGAQPLGRAHSSTAQALFALASTVLSDFSVSMVWIAERAKRMRTPSATCS